MCSLRGIEARKPIGLSSSLQTDVVRGFLGVPSIPFRRRLAFHAFGHGLDGAALVAGIALRGRGIGIEALVRRCRHGGVEGSVFAVAFRE